MLSQVFMYEGWQVRTVTKDDETWFVLKDLCDVLEIGHAPALKQRLSDDVFSNYPIPDSLGRLQDTTIVNEDGMYDVILESRKAEARAFRKWVTGDVLPSIRKTGSYSIQHQFALPQTYSEALRLAAELNDKNEALQLQNAYQEQQLTTQAPKVALYDVAMSVDGVQPVGTVAKELGLGRTRLFALLREKKILRNNNEPYQEYIERGYFKLRMYTITHKSSGLENKTQPMVTPKGIAWLHKVVRGA